MQQRDIESSDVGETAFKQSSHTTIRHRTAVGGHPQHQPLPTNNYHDTRAPDSKMMPRPTKWLFSNPVDKMIIVVLLLVIVLMNYQDAIPSSILNTGKKNQYKGVDFWNPGKTLAVKTLYETPFARFQIHTVQAGKNIIKDWLWCDEMDHINVVVQEQKTGKFVIFRQTKYAIPGPPTLAVVGGFLEPGETSLDAARRELKEELQMESEEWVSLGKYRAAVNRGGGYTHAFLAKNAVEITDKSLEVKGQADLEQQEVLRCTEEELLQYALDGKFGEVKWAATVALSLLKLR